MKTHITLLHTLVALKTRNESLGNLRLVADILLVIARLSSGATHITHACCTVNNTRLRNSVALTIG